MSEQPENPFRVFAEAVDDLFSKAFPAREVVTTRVIGLERTLQIKIINTIRTHIPTSIVFHLAFDPIKYLYNMTFSDDQQTYQYYVSTDSFDSDLTRTCESIAKTALEYLSHSPEHNYWKTRQNLKDGTIIIDPEN